MWVRERERERESWMGNLVGGWNASLVNRMSFVKLNVQLIHTLRLETEASYFTRYLTSLEMYYYILTFLLATASQDVFLLPLSQKLSSEVVYFLLCPLSSV